tara:strand:+ start:5579 stop:5743 length:165 start_codon:yes stop_codon:yes gene_type:complete
MQLIEMNTLPNWIKWDKEKGKYVILHEAKTKNDEQKFAEEKFAEEKADFDRESR